MPSKTHASSRSPAPSKSAVRRFLATFQPLCHTAAGRTAVAEHGCPPFVDGSCRREPDFEAARPAITALSRGAQFAPRLRVTDHVAYLTTVGRYAGADKAAGEEHWRLVALLRVAQRFESHADAAAWYARSRLALPRNLVVPGNPPLAFELTDGGDADPEREVPRATVKRWEVLHRARATEHGAVLVCDVIFRELTDPPAITRAEWQSWCGGVPRTRTPPVIMAPLWNRLLRLAERRG